MVESAALESTFFIFTNLPTMLSFRVEANNMAQAMIVPIAMSTEVDLVPVLDMVPLDHLPPLFTTLRSGPSATPPRQKPPALSDQEPKIKVL